MDTNRYFRADNLALRVMKMKKRFTESNKIAILSAGRPNYFGAAHF
jgi:hypothetical protein